MLSTFKLIGEDQAGNWSREVDYIWMGRRLLGTEDGSGLKKHYHTDHLGSIRLVTNAAGNKVSEHEYLPYGQELTAAGNGVMKFTGHERDPETGMDYMHARFYSSFLGRFNSVDPILGGGGVLNRYSYVGGRPMNLLDPTGRAAAGVTLYWQDVTTVTASSGASKSSAWSWAEFLYNVAIGWGRGPVVNFRPPVDPLANIAPRFWFCEMNPGSVLCQGGGGSDGGGGNGSTGDGTEQDDEGSIIEKVKEIATTVACAVADALTPDESAGFSVVNGGVGGSFVNAWGVEGSIASTISLHNSPPWFESGGLVSTGPGFGFNDSVDAFVGFLSGPPEAIDGQTWNVNASITPASFSLFLDPETGRPLGFTGGPGAGPPGGSLSYSTTHHISSGDAYRAWRSSECP